MPQIFANNVAGTLGANIGPSDTLLLLGGGQGAFFPSPSAGQWFYAALVHIDTGVVEVVQCTQRAGDTLTIVRGRDGTSATSFTSGSVIEMRLTAQVMREVDYHVGANAANGAAVLNGTGKLPDSVLSANVPLMTDGKLLLANMPDSVATDTELQAAVDSLMPKVDPSFTGVMDATSIKTGGAYITSSALPNTVRVYGENNGSTGFIQFGTYGSTLGWNGSYLLWGTGQIWHSGTFDPNTKFDKAGGTLTGWLTLSASSDLVTNRGYIYSTTTMTLGAVGQMIFRANGVNQPSGQMVLGSNGVLNAVDVRSTSDRRAKKHLKKRPINTMLADQIRLFDFTWKHSNEPGAGPIAQDLLEIAPFYVSDVGGQYCVDKAGLALEAVVGLANRVAQLEKQNA